MTSKVIYTAAHARYVIEYRDRGYNLGEWHPLESYRYLDEAVKDADKKAQDCPGDEYRVVDTGAEED